MVGIYKIINPNDKVYIGQSINIEKRWYNHSHPSKSVIGRKLYNSFKKHGIKNHKFEIIEECELTKLNEREIFWKQHYINLLGWEKMLFCELYDRGGGPRSEDIKMKISISSMGKNSKVILQYNLNGEFIKEWDTVKEAEYNYKTGISDVLRGKGKTSGGFIWRYKENPLDINHKISSHKLSKPTNQYDLEGNLIKEWNSLMEIQNELKYPNSNISSCCIGKQKTAYGYKWKYKDEETKSI
jgi:group I intron endonuclease